jgi:hypothetical protein
MCKLPESIRIDVYHHNGDMDQDSGFSAKLDNIIKEISKMSAQLDALSVQVAATTDAEASAVLLLKGLSDQIASLKADPVALQKLSDDLKSGSDNLAAAILANTPAA